MSVRFDVSPVELAPDPPASLALSAAMSSRGLRNALACEVDAPLGLVSSMPLHGLLMAAHLAYTQHRPLTLSPDAIWLCIAQGLARHVDAHAEALRDRLVRHQGQLELEIRRDALDGSSADDWAEAVDALCALIREHLGGRADLFVADFSTTTRASRTASRIALMGAVKQYFKYSVLTLCGIPSITLRGTPEDWASLRQRVAVFGDFDLSWWADGMDSVLAELEATSRGQVNVRFWEDFFKVVNGSGGEGISGWINAFFPYLDEEGMQRNPWFQRHLPGGQHFDIDPPRLSQYPSGLARAPLTWKVLGQDKTLYLVAGFLGARLEQDGGVGPAIGWAVLPRLPERRLQRGEIVGTLVPHDPHLSSLQGIAGEIEADEHQVVHLCLYSCDQLRSLDGLQGIAKLEGITVRGGALADLSALTEIPQLRRLYLSDCEHLSDLRPLLGLPLEKVSICRCPAIRDFAPLASLTSLDRLHLESDVLPAEWCGEWMGRAAVAAIQRKLG